MTNDCKTCPVSTGTHKPAEAMHQIAEPAATPWKDHRTAALVNDLRDCAKTYGNTQQLRERIANIVAPLCDQLKAAELAAVQQGVQPYAVLVFERGEEGPFDRKPVKPDSVQHLHAKRDPHYDYIELYTHPTQQGLDAGNTDADRLIGRLLSSDPDFEDCTAAANLIRELTENGPDGFATWKDAAVAERALRTGMQHAIRALPRVTYGYKSDGESRYLSSYESSEGQFLRHADVMAAIAAQAKQGGA